MTGTQARFAPSEIVLLHGDRFAGEGGMLKGKEELLASEKKVSIEELAASVLSAVVLAHEEAGSIRLEARSKKVLFGLMSRRTLYAGRGAADAQWPEGSLEAQLRAFLRGDSMEVDDLLHALLLEDVPYPPHEVLDRVKQGLAVRGLLRREEVKRMKIFTAHVYRLAEGTEERLRAETPDAVRGLLDGCQRSRPELWQLLQKHVGSALARRKEADDDHDYDPD